METDKAIALVINSYDKTIPAEMEDPDTWCDSVMVYMETSDGTVYAQKLSKNFILNSKMEEAQRGKIELMSSYLKRNYGQVYCLPLGYSITFKDKTEENKDDDITK